MFRPTANVVKLARTTRALPLGSTRHRHHFNFNPQRDTRPTNVTATPHSPKIPIQGWHPVPQTPPLKETSDTKSPISAFDKVADDIMRAMEPYNDLMGKLEPILEAKRDLGSILQMLDDMKVKLAKHEIGSLEWMTIELAGIKREIEALSMTKGDVVDVTALTRQVEILTQYAKSWTKAEADKRMKKAFRSWDVECVAFAVACAAIPVTPVILVTYLYNLRS